MTHLSPTGPSRRLIVLSDVHFASEAEGARRGFELATVDHPLLRLLLRLFRRHVWLHDPLAHNSKLDRVASHAPTPDGVVVNGDLSCDTAFIGVADDAACQSAREAMTLLRTRFGGRVRFVLGDHELGKMSLFGGRGGPRLASWDRACTELGFQPLWRTSLGGYELVGVTSSLVAFPAYEPESLPAERARWHALRREHLDHIEALFQHFEPGQRILLFCHDPTALPFLMELPAVRRSLAAIECTFIGHLHSPLIFRLSRLLAGMPALHFLGHSVRRMSTALNQAACWKDFHVRLCPALAGIQLLKDGGYWEIRLAQPGSGPSDYIFHRIPWDAPGAGQP